MLPERWSELLTAYVDGELTPRERRRVQLLLEESEAAREFLRRLENDSARIRGLPSESLDRDLSGPILNAISSLHGRRSRRRPRLVSSPFPVWAVYVSAASVLLIAALTSLLFRGSVSQKPAAIDETPAVLGKAPGTLVAVDSEGKKDSMSKANAVPSEPPGATHEKEEQPITGPPLAELPRTELRIEESPVLTAPAMELFRPEHLESVTLPVVLPIRDLEQGSSRDKLLTELRKDSAFRVELPCHNTTNAFGKVQSALRTRGVGVVIEQTAQVRLRQPQWKTNFVLFAEDFLPEDLDTVLREIARRDRSERSTEAQFTAVIVTRLSKGHRKELTDLLGIDPVPVSPGLAGPLGTDPHKPLPELTAGQVANALAAGAGQGGSSRVAGAGPLDRQALALAFNPVRPRRGSPDVRHFLDARKPGRPGSLQVLLVLRGM